MSRVEVVRADPGAARPGYGAPSCALTGAAASARVCPPDASIWMLAARLEAGASLAFDSAHGDEALYVEAGELSVDGRICPEGGAIVVEAGASPRIEAHGASRVLHMGSRTPRAAGARAEGGARGVHVVGPRGVCEAIEPGRETRFFADATCPTCGVWLLYTSRFFAYEGPIHSHSQDELIHVLRGEISLGSLRAGQGDTLFVAADQPYRFRAGASGFAFLNYRRAASVMTMRATGETIVENGRATGMKPPVDGDGVVIQDALHARHRTHDRARRSRDDPPDGGEDPAVDAEEGDEEGGRDVMAESGKLDPSKGWRAVEARLDATTDPRQRAILACLRDHLLAEAKGDFDLLLSTLAPRPDYHFWIDGSGFGAGPRGLAGVRAHYEQLFEEGRSVCEYDIERIVVDRDVVVTEGWFDQLFPGHVLRKRGAAIDDPDAVYAHRMRLVLLWPFDANARLVGEDSYSNGPMYLAGNLRKLPAAEIPPVYYDRLRAREAPARA